MLANAFDNVGLFGKQEFRLIFARSHRFEIGSFAVMVKHGREQRRNGSKHFLGRKPIIGSEERIEKPFELFLVQDLESIHVIRAEIMVHGTRKKDRKFPEQFGIVGELRHRKAIEVVKIARVVPVNHRLRLATEQFLYTVTRSNRNCSSWVFKFVEKNSFRSSMISKLDLRHEIWDLPYRDRVGSVFARDCISPSRALAPK